ncbi:MAG: hypothetical protein L3J29_03445 [Cyclobacteriaceae bacterium]|nr:hypothetical protein [Cyclobacteriaceae bacterium]
MNKFLSIIIIFSASAVYGQKVKSITNFTSWSINVKPRVKLDDSKKITAATIKTPIIPLSANDLRKFKMNTLLDDNGRKTKYFEKIINDTLNAWAGKYLVLQGGNFKAKGADDFANLKILLTTSEYNIKNVNFDLDYSDSESVVCIIDVSGTVLVKSTLGDVYLDAPVKFKIDHFEGKDSNQLKLSDLGAKYSSDKKSVEKKREMLMKKMDKYESYVLKDLVIETQELLRMSFFSSRVDYNVAIFGIKDKKYASINLTAEKVSKEIKLLSSLSKKKRKTLEQIRPSLVSAVNDWIAAAEDTENIEIQKFFYANISLVSAILEDFESTKMYFDKIPEAKNISTSGIVSNTFKYYVKILFDVLETKEKYGSFTETFEY